MPIDSCTENNLNTKIDLLPLTPPPSANQSSALIRVLDHVTNTFSFAAKHVVSIGPTIDDLLDGVIEFKRASQLPVMSCPFTEREFAKLQELLSHREAPFFKDAKFQREKIALSQAILNEIDSLTKEREECYSLRQMMVAEVLVKHFAMCDPDKGCRLVVPCLNKDGKACQVEYEITHKIELSDTHIPVIGIIPCNPDQRGEFGPIVIFRGTSPHFSSQGGIRSLVENLDTNGPARGVYHQSFAEIQKMIEDIYRKGCVDKGKKIQVLGYSQGSSLAARAIIDFNPMVDTKNPSFLFNPPGVEKDYRENWEKLSEDVRPCVKSFIVSQDVVSKAGEFHIGDVFEVAPKKSSVSDAHYGCRLTQPSWKMFQIDAKEEAKSEIRQLINRARTSGKVKAVYNLITGNFHYLSPITAFTEGRSG